MTTYMAQKPLPSLAAPLLCHFCFPTLCSTIFKAPKGRIYKICFMCSNFYSIFRTYFAIANIFSIPYFFPLQIMHECAKEVRLRTFFALPNLCVCFL